MIDQIRQTIVQRLDELDGVVALRKSSEGVAPHVFQKGDDLSTLEINPKYPLTTLVSRLHKLFPAIRLGVVARGCDERAYIEMAKRNQIDPERLFILGFACTIQEAQECNCVEPYPRGKQGEKETGKQGMLIGTPQQAGTPNPLVARYDAMTLAERRAFWRQQFAKCLKCYGCRNICPECFCEACAMEDAAWVEPGLLTPPFPTFHLIRAMHMASRCIACRECESACPAHIPLTVLYDLMRRDIGTLVGYIPGADVTIQPPLSVSLEQASLRQGDPHHPHTIPLAAIGV